MLRIEDTDRARHNEAAVDAILDGLSWLGLDWDDEPISQYQNRERHVQIAEKLLADGQAYRCYLTTEEIEQRRNEARESGERFVSPWREDAATPPPNLPFSIRFRAPDTGETIIKDAVQGEVKIPNTALDDLIIVRGDGTTPTYNLAVVVDDHDMGVTHIVRGDDHLVNAARQAQIYQALGWPVPIFAHVPLIHGQDGSKLSKRHGALGVEAYRDDGYLSEALSNYLIRLGWAHGDEEIIPRDRALEIFDLSGINKSPSRLDFDKLNHINSTYMAALSNDDFAKLALPFLGNDVAETTPDFQDRFERSVPFLKERVITLKDIGDAAKFLTIKRPLEITGKAAKPLKKDGVIERLQTIYQLLSETEDWSNAEALDNVLIGYAEAENVGFGQIGPPVRAVLTAGHPAPSLGQVLFSLGKAESLARIEDQTAK